MEVLPGEHRVVVEYGQTGGPQGFRDTNIVETYTQVVSWTAVAGKTYIPKYELHSVRTPNGEMSQKYDVWIEEFPPGTRIPSVHWKWFLEGFVRARHE
jgi:hypothetical protein